jgi:hypothetical protein
LLWRLEYSTEDLLHKNPFLGQVHHQPFLKDKGASAGMKMAKCLCDGRYKAFQDCGIYYITRLGAWCGWSVDQNWYHCYTNSFGVPIPFLKMDWTLWTGANTTTPVEN